MGRQESVPSAFVAWNFLCQGVSEVLKWAIVLVSEAYRARQMCSQVALDMHDALILEAAHEEWTEALPRAVRSWRTARQIRSTSRRSQ